MYMAVYYLWLNNKVWSIYNQDQYKATFIQIALIKETAGIGGLEWNLGSSIKSTFYYKTISIKVIVGTMFPRSNNVSGRMRHGNLY